MYLIPEWQAAFSSNSNKNFLALNLCLQADSKAQKHETNKSMRQRRYLATVAMAKMETTNTIRLVVDMSWEK